MLNIADTLHTATATRPEACPAAANSTSWCSGWDPESQQLLLEALSAVSTGAPMGF